MGTIDDKLKRMPRTVRVGVVPGGLSEFTTIQAAIDWCNTQAVPAPAAATPYTVEIWPGVYDEVVTMANSIHLRGIGPPGSVIIQQTDATILTTADSNIENVTIRLVTPTAGRSLVTDPVGGATTEFNQVRFEITTPAALAHVVIDIMRASTLRIANCYASIEGTGASFLLSDTNVGATWEIWNNDFIFNNVNAYHIRSGIGGTWTGGNNRWAGTSGWASVSAGNIRFDGDRVDCSGGSNISGGPVTIKGGEQTYHVWAGMLIQHAITEAAADTPAPAATAPYTILIHPGIYDEAITCSSWVNLKGIGPKGSIVIQQTDAIILNLADNVELQNFTIRLVTPSANRWLILDNAAASTVRFTDLVLEVTTPGAFDIYLFTFTGAGDYTIERCSCNIGGTGTNRTFRSTTNASTIHLINNDFQHENVNSRHIDMNVASTITGGGNRWAGTGRMFQVSLGTILFHGDVLDCGTASSITGGSVCIKNGRQQYEVWDGMLVQHAITAAAADTPTPAAATPYTILIHPGIYDEQITCSTWVNLKGVGPRGSVVIYQLNHAVGAFIVTLATNVEIENLTVRLGTPSADNKYLLGDNAVACIVRLTNIVLEIVTPGTWATTLLRFLGAGNYTIERCSYNVGGTGGHNGILSNTNAATIHLINNDFTFSNVNARHIFSFIASTWTGHGNRWTGNSQMFVVTAGTLTFDNCAIVCTEGWTNTGSTITLRHCVIEAPVVAGNGALVRLKNCSYRAINRAGTGNIVDESPHLQDAPWKVHKWNWMTALANMDVAVRGTPIDAGSGQVLLEVTDNVAGQEAVETSPEAAGALGNEFTPARTPRIIKQISVDSFDADVTMFFGLRATLGNAVPGPGEDHAGFDWDGTNFRAISSDGAGVGEQTNLALPSANVQHQLEVIILGGQQVEFYIDGVLVATHSTAAGIPNVGLDWQHLLATAGAGAGDVIQVTVRPGGCQECPA